MLINYAIKSNIIKLISIKTQDINKKYAIILNI